MVSTKLLFLNYELLKNFPNVTPHVSRSCYSTLLIRSVGSGSSSSSSTGASPDVESFEATVAASVFFFSRYLNKEGVFLNLSI